MDKLKSAANRLYSFRLERDFRFGVVFGIKLEIIAAKRKLVKLQIIFAEQKQNVRIFGLFAHKLEQHVVGQRVKLHIVINLGKKQLCFKGSGLVFQRAANQRDSFDILSLFYKRVRLVQHKLVGGGKNSVFAFVVSH